MTLLVFFPTPAGTGVISANLPILSYGLRPRGPAAGRFIKHGLFFLFFAQLLHLFFALDLNMKEQPDGFFLHPLDHVLENLVGFALIRDQWVLLTIAAQADPLLEMVHVEEMVFPVTVHSLQQNVILQVLHHGWSELPFAGVVALANQVEEIVQEVSLAGIPERFHGIIEL